MKDDPTSLQNLHDLVSPAEVNWWPWAPGWYLIGGAFIVIVLWRLIRGWNRWKAGEYRRQALRELHQTDSTAEMLRILRRTALALVPRSEVAALQGQEWADWIAGRGVGPIPDELKRELTVGAYQADTGGRDLPALRNYIESWIQHQGGANENRNREV